jgi:hypothetical protein
MSLCEIAIAQAEYACLPPPQAHSGASSNVPANLLQLTREEICQVKPIFNFPRSRCNWRGEDVTLLSPQINDMVKTVDSINIILVSNIPSDNEIIISFSKRILVCWFGCSIRKFSYYIYIITCIMLYRESLCFVSCCVAEESQYSGPTPREWLSN